MKKTVVILLVMVLFLGVTPVFGQMDAWAGWWATAVSMVSLAMTYQSQAEGRLIAATAAAVQAEYDKRCVICIAMAPTHNTSNCEGYEPTACGYACERSKVPRT